MSKEDQELQTGIRDYLQGQQAARNASPTAPARDPRLDDDKTPAGLRQRLQWEFDSANDAYVQGLLLKKTLTDDEQKLVSSEIAKCLRDMGR